MAILLSALLGTSGVNDERQFKKWQDFYSYNVKDVNGSEQYVLPDSTRIISGSSVSRRIPSNGTTTWTVPSGVTKVRLTCVGAGGGGSYYWSYYYGGTGGSGGGFASGEFTVTPGQVLNVSVGSAGGYPASSGSYAGTGGTASVTGTGISVSATGGGGSYSTSTIGAVGTGSVSGANLVSGTNLTASGGSGGIGSQQAFGFGPEGYGAGGGGSAGSYKGNGYNGASGNNGGYSYSSGGGGGIGGAGAVGGGSNTSSIYNSWAGGGGGSNGAGAAGTSNTTAWNPYGGSGSTTVIGTNGVLNVAGQGNYTGYVSDAWYLTSSGSRYADGESIATGNPYEAAYSAATASLSYKQKTFNGVLGLCVGGGGAGAPTYDNNFGNYNHSGGDGGSGGGGGGAAGVQTSWNSGDRNITTYHEFDPSNLAWRVKPSARNNNSQRLNGYGGNGGALAGGGGSACYAAGGCGGIGGGGGGGGGHYSGSSYYGQGGIGGPGYVLIEW